MNLQAKPKTSAADELGYLHRTALIAALTLGATVSQSFAADAPTFQEGVSAEQSLVSQSIEPFAASSSLQLAFMDEETATDGSGLALKTAEGSSEESLENSADAIKEESTPGAEIDGGDREAVPSAQEQADDDDEDTWLDTGHGYVTGKADDLTRWFDSYFGSTESDQAAASSRLRLRVMGIEDEREGTNFRVSVGGQVNLPQISKRLDLVFRGDDPADNINGQEDQSQAPVALQLQVGKREDTRHRFDLTLGISSAGPKPGARYRYTVDLNEKNSLQFTERVQYEFDDGVISTSRLVLDHQLSNNALLRSYSRVLWGEATEGVEASTSLQWIKFWRRDPPSRHRVDERGLMVYGEVSGQTEPYDYVSNYRVGFRYRRQTYREYLFLEFEPSYNWRVDEPYDQRAGAWKVELRFEFLLFDDLRRDKD